MQKKILVVLYKKQSWIQLQYKGPPCPACLPSFLPLRPVHVPREVEPDSCIAPTLWTPPTTYCRMHLLLPSA